MRWFTKDGAPFEWPVVIVEQERTAPPGDLMAALRASYDRLVRGSTNAAPYICWTDSPAYQGIFQID